MRFMRMGIAGVLCALVLSGDVFAPATVAKQSGSAVVEDAVYDALGASADGTTYVIVMLQAVSMPVGASAAQVAQVQTDVAALQSSVLSSLSPGAFSPVYLYGTFSGMTGHVSAVGLAELAAHPEVAAVGLDAAGQATLDVSVPFINADDVHTNVGVTGQGITVAVLDTGIDTDHADLSDDIAAGAWHFLDQGANTGPGAEDDNGHGTNVSGIITSKGAVAPVGVAPDADILAVKVLKADNSGWLSDWAAGVDYVVQHRNDYARLCAINMSLGSFALYAQCPCDNATTFNQALQAAIQAAKNAGIVTFASSGNNGSCTSMSSPACVSAATPVAAVYDQDLGREPNAGTYQSNFGSSFGACFDATTAGDIITCFSNRSGCNELAAPGRLITAPGIGGGLSTYTGTSQASPHCAGVAALMCECAAELSLNLTPDYIVQVMKDTGHGTNDPCSTNPNPIRVDALAAVIALKPVTVLVTAFAARPVELGVAISWEIFADEAVSGFRIYRSSDREGGFAVSITNDLIASNVRDYLDRAIEPGTTYEYVLAAVTTDGTEHRSFAAKARPLSAATKLEQNSPNPFNPVTTIAYTLSEPTDVTMAVYDAAGRLVVTLEKGSRGAGPHSIEWNGRDARGVRMPSGVYFYRLTAGTQTLTRKAVLMR